MLSLTCEVELFPTSTDDEQDKDMLQDDGLKTSARSYVAVLQKRNYIWYISFT